MVFRAFFTKYFSDMLELKIKIYQHYLTALNLKIDTVQNKLGDLHNSLLQETKSTAGDKYETGRAMIHIEQENIQKQLATLLQQKAEMDSIDISTFCKQITRGCLVKTNKGFLFMSIAQGKAIIEDKVVYALSPQSPLGQILIGLKANAEVTFNGITYLIEAIA